MSCPRVNDRLQQLQSSQRRYLESSRLDPKINEDDELAIRVTEAVGIVIERKKMLEEGMLSLGRREPLSNRHKR